MIQQTSQTIRFVAFFASLKVGKTGLTVTIDLYNPAGTLVVTAGSATAIGGGLYYYDYASTSSAGNWVAIFKTTDTTVDAQHVPSLWVIGPIWANNLDTALSAMISSPTHSGTAQAGGASTITFASGASSVDNLYQAGIIILTGGTGAGQWRRINAYVGSTKVATVGRAWSTNPDSTTTYRVFADVGAAVDSNLAVTVGTNSDKTGYSLASPQTFNLTGNVTGNVSGSVGSVSGSVGSVASYGTLVADVAAAVWAAGTRSLTTFGTLVPDMVTAVWAAGTRSLTTFGTLVPDMVTAVWAAGTRSLTAFGFTVNVSSNSDITSIKARTDLIGTNDADSPNAVTAHASAATAVTNTASLPGMIETSGGYQRYKSRALEQAPTGGGGGGSTTGAVLLTARLTSAPVLTATLVTED